MGLSKLLAVGRSVRSVTEQPARYKMTQQNLLPTFGGAKATEARPVDEVSPAAEAAPKPATAEPAARTAVDERAGAGSSEPGRDKVAAFLEATKKLRPFGGGSWFKNPFARTIARKQEKGPVQTELSLDSVRPVRNDLSDLDVELGRAPGQAAHQPGTPRAPMAVPALTAAADGGLWQAHVDTATAGARAVPARSGSKRTEALENSSIRKRGDALRAGTARAPVGVSGYARLWQRLKERLFGATDAN